MYYIDNTRYTTLFCTIDHESALYGVFNQSSVQISSPDCRSSLDRFSYNFPATKIISLFYEKSLFHSNRAEPKGTEGLIIMWIRFCIDVDREVPLRSRSEAGCFVDKPDPDGSARDIRADTGN